MPSSSEKIIPNDYPIVKKEVKKINVRKMVSGLTFYFNENLEKLFENIHQINNDNYIQLKELALTLLKELEEKFENSTTDEEEQIINTLMYGVNLLFCEIIDATSNKKYPLSLAQEKINDFSNFLQNKNTNDNSPNVFFEIAKNIAALFIIGGFSIAGGILGASIGLAISSIFFPLAPITASAGIAQGVIIGATVGGLLLLAISTLLTKPILDYATDFSENKISPSKTAKLNYHGFFSKNPKVVTYYQSLIGEAKNVITNKI